MSRQMSRHRESFVLSKPSPIMCDIFWTIQKKSRESQCGFRVNQAPSKQNQRVGLSLRLCTAAHTFPQCACVFICCLTRFWEEMLVYLLAGG